MHNKVLSMLEENIQIFKNKIISDKEEQNIRFNRVELMNQHCYLIDELSQCLIDGLMMTVDSSGGHDASSHPNSPHGRGIEMIIHVLEFIVGVEMDRKNNNNKSTNEVRKEDIRVKTPENLDMVAHNTLGKLLGNYLKSLVKILIFVSVTSRDKDTQIFQRPIRVLKVKIYKCFKCLCFLLNVCLNCGCVWCIGI